MSTYKDAGVDLEKSDDFISHIHGKASMTLRPEVVSHIGGFAGGFALPTGYKDPILISGTDGVGTKVKLARTKEHLNAIGGDLVGMVVNDLICTGAEPLFFLDYYASGSLNAEAAQWVIEGMCDALIHCNVALLGGETAEMPGMYQNGEFDVAGFGVGIVEREKLLDGQANVREGDVLIGIESSGPHSNGFSLIRKIFDQFEFDGGDSNELVDIKNQVMIPTTLYPPAIKDVLASVPVKAIANITGGGLLENIPRVVDSFWGCVIDASSWNVPDLFWWLQKVGKVPIEEMYRVFNMGIGMVIIVEPNNSDAVQKILQQHEITNWKIGEVVSRNSIVSPVIIS